MDTPEGWDLTGKKAVISADRRGWTGFFAAALTEAGADIAIIQTWKTPKTRPLAMVG